MTLFLSVFIPFALGCVLEAYFMRKRQAEAEQKRSHLEDRLNFIDKQIQELFKKLEKTEEKISVATELSVINNKFIETVKQTAKEQAEASKSRISTLQNRYMR